MDFKLTPAVVRLLQAFLTDPDAPRYGMQLMKEARVSSGTLYPALTRLERAGWIIGETEDIDPAKEGRPARRYYTMTGDGARAAHLELTELSERSRPPVQAPGWLPGTGAEGA
ncbi:PadR family transcriptional regulator [Streptomyces sp. NPDC090080]|uniref:PadR family transcriptional regulator n=1 Tax=Streptomyces sp. NPDC090080 TaxID=3365939 RepID=UPI00381F95B1